MLQRNSTPKLPILVLGLSCLLATGLYGSSPPLAPGSSSSGDPEEATWVGLLIPQTGELPEVEAHPSLYFRADFIPTLKARKDGEVPDPEGYYASRWAVIQTRANSYLGTAVSSNDDEKCMAAKALAFAWLLTDNTAYRDKAVANLTEAFTSIQSTDDYVSMHVTNYALAYDWIAADLSPAEDAAIRAAVKRGADWLSNYLLTGGARNHNHRSKAGAALGSWALAFSSDADAPAYLNTAMKGMHDVWKYMFTQDGIYRDGAGYYWVYTFIHAIPFFWQYRNVSGVDLFDIMQPAFEWELKTSTPEGWLPNIEDSWYKTTWLVTVAAAYKDTPTTLSGTGTLGELFQWRFFESSWLPVRYDKNWAGAGRQLFVWPDEFVLYDSTIAQVQPDDLAGSVDFNAGPRGGAVVLRNNWDYGNPATRYLYFEGTPMSFNHDHADALQFIIHAENTILARDNGYGPERFSGRSSYNKASYHNVMTANGVALGDPLPTNIFISSRVFDFVEKQADYYDSTASNRSTHKRAIAFPGKEYFVVYDRGTAAVSKTWDNYYHNRGSMTGAGNRRVWTTSDGPWGAAAKMTTCMLPSSMTISTGLSKFNPFGTTTTNDGYPYPGPETDLEDTPYLKMRQTGTSVQFMQILIPQSLDAGEPVITDLSVGPVLAARVDLDGVSDHFLGSAGSGPVTAGVLASDGAFSHVRAQSQSVDYWMLHEGTTLEFDGAETFSSTAQVSAFMDLSDPQLHHGTISGDGTYTVRIRYTGGFEIGKATFNGQSVAPEQGDGFVQLTLSGAGDLELHLTSFPLRPEDLEGSPFSSSVIILNWRDTAGNETGFEIQRRNGLDPFVTIARIGPDYTAFSDTKLSPDTSYSYRIRSVNGAGASAFTNEVLATTLPVAQDHADNQLFQWVEAESASIQDNFAPWIVGRDPLASAGAYVVSELKSTSSVPADGRLSFPFSLDQAATVSIWARLITTSTGDDSLRMRIDQDPFADWSKGFTLGGDWYWVLWKAAPLDAGPHSLEMTYRENPLVDKLLLTTDSNYLPNNVGAPQEADINYQRTIFDGPFGTKQTPLGWLDDTAFPYILHAEHGWLYIIGSASPYLWMYDYRLGWLATGFSVYPYLFSYARDTWLWYAPGSRTPRWFYDYTQAAWWTDIIPL